MGVSAPWIGHFTSGKESAVPVAWSAVWGPKLVRTWWRRYKF